MEPFLCCPNCGNFNLQKITQSVFPLFPPRSVLRCPDCGRKFRDPDVLQAELDRRETQIPAVFFLFSILLWLFTVILFGQIGATRKSLMILLSVAVLGGGLLFCLIRLIRRRKRRKLQQLREQMAHFSPKTSKKKKTSA